MSNATLTVSDDDGPLRMEISFSDGDYDPTLPPHVMLVECWNILRDASDRADAKADAPKILLPGGTA